MTSNGTSAGGRTNGAGISRASAIHLSWQSAPSRRANIGRDNVTQVVPKDWTITEILKKLEELRLVLVNKGYPYATIKINMDSSSHGLAAGGIIWCGEDSPFWCGFPWENALDEDVLLVIERQVHQIQPRKLA